MKIFTIGLILAAFASYSACIDAQAAKYCEDELDSYLEFFPEFMATCKCTAGSDNVTYTLSCQDGCESCDDENENCGIRSFTVSFDSLGGSYDFRDCIEFTTGSFDGDVICYGKEADDCSISVNGEDCSSCEYRLTECGMKGEDYFLYADCKNVDEIDAIVDECKNDGFGGILSPSFTAYYPGETCRATNESEAALWCEDSRQMNMELYPEFMRTCECIPGESATYILSCEDNCESCDGAEDCGIRSYTEVIDPYSMGLEFRDCFEHLQGDFEGDKVCFGTSYSNDTGTENCSISVNDEDCKSCEYVYKSCGTFGEATFLVADCTNVDEIGVVVDECENKGFDGALSSFFSSFDVGTCNTNSTGNWTYPPEQGAEELCNGEMEFYESFTELETSCECIAGSDNITYTLSCQDGCETCDSVSKVCGIRSLSELIDPQGGYEYRDCLQYTQGSFEGNKVCIEVSSSSSEVIGGCVISVNEKNCASCEYEDKVCFGSQGFFMVANCTNVDEIGVVVDECSGSGLGEDDILSSFYTAYEVGSCNITDQTTEPPDQTTEPLESTSGAKSESLMTVSCILVAAVLFTSLSS